jgi:hypothetical protein
LWADQWTGFISKIPEASKRELLERISDENGEQDDTRGATAVLAATSDLDVAREVFSRLCTIRAKILAAARKSTTNLSESTRNLWEASRRLEELFRTMPPDIAVSGVLNCPSPNFDAIKYAVVIDLFGRIGVEDSDFRTLMKDDRRQLLRKYLKEGVSFALSQDDFNGHLKAHLALALARVGDPEDMDDLYRLVQAEIERRRRGIAARLRGERGPLADGGTTGWSNWYVRAITWLDPQRAEEVLLKLLSEPDFEEDTGRELIQLAKIQNTEKQAFFNRPDYRVVWEARARRQPSGFEEDRRRRYSAAIKERISTIMKDAAKSTKPDSFNRRLKELAKSVAILDGRDSAEYVMEIMALPGKWDEWTRVDALEALVFSGARFGAEPALRVLNPTIDYALNHLYDQQAVYLLTRCLYLLPFLDPPSKGIEWIKEVLAARRFPTYELREVVTALGHSRCNDAFEFLRELARTVGNGFKAIAGEWIAALAALESPESKRVLLSFVDPDIEQVSVEQQFEHYDRERLASRIVDIARAEPAVRERLYLLCNRELSPAMRLLLAQVITGLSTPDAAIAGLNLIHDDANPPIPYSLTSVHENAFFEHRPYGTGGWYIRVPRSAPEIRRRLFEMVLNDDTRRGSAWRFLGQIESWRLEYGRPNSEPRHPSFDTGEPWPPIKSALKSKS